MHYDYTSFHLSGRKVFQTFHSLFFDNRSILLMMFLNNIYHLHSIPLFQPGYRSGSVSLKEYQLRKLSYRLPPFILYLGEFLFSLTIDREYRGYCASKEEIYLSMVRRCFSSIPSSSRKSAISNLNFSSFTASFSVVRIFSTSCFFIASSISFLSNQA